MSYIDNIYIYEIAFLYYVCVYVNSIRLDVRAHMAVAAMTRRAPLPLKGNVPLTAHTYTHCFVFLILYIYVCYLRHKTYHSKFMKNN